MLIATDGAFINGLNALWKSNISFPFGYSIFSGKRKSTLPFHTLLSRLQLLHAAAPSISDIVLSYYGGAFFIATMALSARIGVDFNLGRFIVYNSDSIKAIASSCLTYTISMCYMMSTSFLEALGLQNIVQEVLSAELRTLARTIQSVLKRLTDVR